MVNIWALCALQYAALHFIFLSSQHFRDEETEIQDVPSLPKVKRVESSGPGDEIRLLSSSTQDHRQLCHHSPHRNVFDFLSFFSLYCHEIIFYSLNQSTQFCFSLFFFFNLMSFFKYFPHLLIVFTCNITTGCLVCW